METITINKDITVCYVQATSFPDGVLQAHQALHALFSFDGKRRFFGLSRPEGGNGRISYKAAAEELREGEAKAIGLDTLVLKKGRYISMMIPDFRKDIPAIGKAFTELLQQPRIDPEGYCVELYPNMTDVQCMVRLAD